MPLRDGGASDVRKILIVDDEVQVRTLLADYVSLEGHTPMLAADGESALELIDRERPDVVLLDLRLPGINGLEVLRRGREIDEDLPVVMMSGVGGVQDAVEAMKCGAKDYIPKPFRRVDVYRAVGRCLEDRELHRRIRRLSQHVPEASYLGELMGPSTVIERLVEEVARVAQSDYSVIITGETGTGKELVARAIHQSGARKDADFVPVDCGAIPETLFESELFGHEKGAFTGAEQRKPGRFELASGGTLFLDEISNMPLACQAKLLRAVQEKRLTPVGGRRLLDVDVRILAASNRDLHSAAVRGDFRLDLFYRLNEYTIEIPPLRDRREDVLYLAKRFLDLTNHELRKNVRGFTESALELLMKHEWPGNVRELRSSVRRAALLADGMIEKRHLGPLVSGRAGPLSEDASALIEIDDDLSLGEIVRRAVETVERSALTRALDQAGGNKAAAARRLRINYKTIHTKLKRLGLSEPRAGSGE